MGDGFVLPPEFRLAALQKLMSGSQQSKGAYEQLMMEGKGHEVILQKCKGYAQRRRMEYSHRRGNDPMDLDVLKHTADVEEGWMTGQGEGAWEWSFNPWQVDYQEASELDYFNNNSTGGKSKGKGKSFKGYGKGPYSGGPKGAKGSGASGWMKGKTKSKNRSNSFNFNAIFLNF